MAGNSSKKKGARPTNQATKIVRTAPKITTQAVKGTAVEISDDSDSEPDNNSEFNLIIDYELAQVEDKRKSKELVCDICFDAKRPSLFHEGKLAPTCRHASSLCKECVTMGIQSQLSDKQWEAIECVLCKVVLPSNTIRNYLTAGDFQRYNDYISTYHISKAKLYTACQYPTCDSGQIHYGGGRNPRMTCNKCGHITCYSCKVPWHHGRSCKSFKRARLAAAIEAKINALPEEERSEAKIKITTNICPGCKVPVERWMGCPNMKCVCGTAFYWQDPSKNPDVFNEPPPQPQSLEQAQLE